MQKRLAFTTKTWSWTLPIWNVLLGGATVLGEMHVFVCAILIFAFTEQRANDGNLISAHKRLCVEKNLQPTLIIEGAVYYIKKHTSQRLAARIEGGWMETAFSFYLDGELFICLRWILRHERLQYVDSMQKPWWNILNFSIKINGGSIAEKIKLWASGF